MWEMLNLFRIFEKEWLRSELCFLRWRSRTYCQLERFQEIICKFICDLCRVLHFSNSTEQIIESELLNELLIITTCQRGGCKVIFSAMWVCLSIYSWGWVRRGPMWPLPMIHWTLNIHSSAPFFPTSVKDPSTPPMRSPGIYCTVPH